MVINTNTSALTSATNLEQSQAMLSKSLARLSSGSKIVSPADDAAGLAVSARMDAKIKRLNAAKTNVGNAISFTQTQDGYLQKIAKALDRMSELAMMAQDVTKTDADRTLYNSEFAQIGDYINNVATKDFNGLNLFGTTVMNVTIDSEGNTFTMQAIDVGAGAYTVATASSITTIPNAVQALTNVKAAIDKLAQDRSTVGANQTRLVYTSEQLTVSKENLTAASSRIKDVDVAEESTEFARYNILVQSGTAMLAQANQMPATVLKLLQ